MSLEVHGGRSFAEATILYDKAVDALGKRVNDADSDYDEDALEKDKKILKRELEVCRKNVGPARGPGGEGSKGKALKDIKVNTLNYNEEPTGGDFPDCKAARAALVATCGKWTSPASGVRGGGTAAKQSYHVKLNEEKNVVAACKIKLVEGKARIFGLEDAEEAPLDSWVRILVHLTCTFCAFLCSLDHLLLFAFCTHFRAFLAHSLRISPHFRRADRRRRGGGGGGGGNGGAQGGGGSPEKRPGQAAGLPGLRV